MRGLWAEGRQWLESLLERTESHLDLTALRATAFGGLGTLAARMRDFERAVKSYEQCLALSRAVGDQRQVAFALGNLGYLADNRGDRSRAETLLEESLALYRGLGDERGIATALDALGLIALLHGDRRRAGALLQESLAHSRAVSDHWQMAITLMNLGVLANHRRDYVQARERFEESVALARAAGGNWFIAFGLVFLGLVAQEQGDLGSAARLFGEGLALCRDQGAQLPAPRCLEGLAAVANARGVAERAARLFGAAEAMRATIQAPMLLADRAIYEPIIAGVRRRLGEATFAAAWAAGQALPAQSAIDEAMAVAIAEVPAQETARVLTVRQREILRLLAAGHSNREIGSRLFISPVTVARHLANLYGKIGVDSRAQAVAYAHRHGLS
jgi:DNA-binding CsgD family transcriptional regulator/uncharacterized protein HemY